MGFVNSSQCSSASLTRPPGKKLKSKSFLFLFFAHRVEVPAWGEDAHHPPRPSHSSPILKARERQQKTFSPEAQDLRQHLASNRPLPSSFPGGPRPAPAPCQQQAPPLRQPSLRPQDLRQRTCWPQAPRLRLSRPRPPPSSTMKGPVTPRRTGHNTTTPLTCMARREQKTLVGGVSVTCTATPPPPPPPPIAAPRTLRGTETQGRHKCRLEPPRMSPPSCHVRSPPWV